MAQIVSVNLSPRKGTAKQPVPEARLEPHVGLPGDAHAGDWSRQVSLLAEESAAGLRALLPDLKPGAFGENLTTRGLCLRELPLGTRLAIGDAAVVEITQIGKECHQGCAIQKATGKCVMPTEGVFAVVLRGGTVRPGDELRVLKEAVL